MDYYCVGNKHVCGKNWVIRYIYHCLADEMIAGKPWTDELYVDVMRRELKNSFLAWVGPQTDEAFPHGPEFLKMFSFLNIHVGKRRIHFPALVTAKRLFSRETHIGFWAEAPPI